MEHPRSFHSKASKSTLSITSFPPTAAGLYTATIINVTEVLFVAYRMFRENARPARQQRAAKSCRSALASGGYCTSSSRSSAWLAERQPFRA